MANKNNKEKLITPDIDTKVFSHVRTLFRHAYLYGTFSDNVIIDNKLVPIQKRQLASTWDTLSYFFETYQKTDDFLSTHKLPGRKNDKKAHHIFIDPFQCDLKALASLYSHCILNETELCFYLFLFSCFHDSDEHQYDDAYNPYLLHPSIDTCGIEFLSINKSYSIVDLCKILNDIRDTHYQSCLNGTITENDALLFEYKNLRKELIKLTDLGILIKEKKGANTFYRLADDIFDFYSTKLKSPDSFLSLNHLVTFCFNTMPFPTPGYLLGQKLEILYHHASGNYEETGVTKNYPTFHYKNTNYQNIVDDSILWSLFEFIHKKKAISYTYNSISNNSKERVIQLFPLKIICDHQYGRQYLFGYNFSERNSSLYRIDCISNVTVTNDKQLATTAFMKKIKNGEYYDDYCAKHYTHYWNVLPQHANDHPVRLLFDFSDASIFSNHLKEKLLHNPHNASCIIKHNEDFYEMNISVPDPAEMIPWIHSFGKYVSIDKEICPSLFAQLQNQEVELKKLYGII